MSLVTKNRVCWLVIGFFFLCVCLPQTGINTVLGSLINKSDVNSPDMLQVLQFLAKIRTRALKAAFIALTRTLGRRLPDFIPTALRQLDKLQSYCVRLPKKTPFEFKVVQNGKVRYNYIFCDIFVPFCAIAMKISNLILFKEVTISINAVRPLHYLAKDYAENGDSYAFEYAATLTPRQRALWMSQGVKDFQHQFRTALSGHSAYIPTFSKNLSWICSA